MRAVRVDHAASRWIECDCGIVDAVVQLDGLARGIALDQIEPQVQPCNAAWIERAETCVGRGDQIAVVEPEADVAGAAMHIAAIEQAFANAADFLANSGFNHDKDCDRFATAGFFWAARHQNRPIRRFYEQIGQRIQYSGPRQLSNK